MRGGRGKNQRAYRPKVQPEEGEGGQTYKQKTKKSDYYQEEKQFSKGNKQRANDKGVKNVE